MTKHTALLACLALLAACSAGSTPGGDAEAPSASASPDAESGAASGEDANPASNDPLAACDGVESRGEPIEIEVGTASWAFDTETIEGPAHCQPFVIVFTNSDVALAGGMMGGTYEHNIYIRLDNLLGPLAFKGESIGTTTIRYEIPGLPAGTHVFYCALHADVMRGDLIITGS